MAELRKVLKVKSFAFAIALSTTLASWNVQAQNPARTTKEEAVVAVDGVVRQVFRSPRQARTDFLVQIEVNKSEARKPVNSPVRPHFPGPGEFVYVHVFQPDKAGILRTDEGFRAVPAERSQIRAFLVPGEQGQWEGAFPDWFDVTSDQLATSRKTDPAPAGGTIERTTVTTLGMTTEAAKIGDRLVMKVKSVERGSPAHQAGLEVGDTIIGVKNEGLKSETQIDELAKRGEPMSIIVLDVNTGQAAKVELKPALKPGDPQPNQPAAPVVERKSLGLSAEPVSLGQRTALKVNRVEPGSPAQKAGIEPNDIVVAANGSPITSPEQLGSALRKSGPILILTVRDSRTGREVPVKVAIAGGEKSDGGRIILDGRPEGGTEVAVQKPKLGAVTELTFYDVEAAVKVTEVEPNSPAARAGLQPGIIILEADGKPILHPNDLLDATRNSAGVLKLKTVDPRTGNKGTVDVQLR